MIPINPLWSEVKFSIVVKGPITYANTILSLWGCLQRWTSICDLSLRYSVSFPTVYCSILHKFSPFLPKLRTSFLFPKVHQRHYYILPATHVLSFEVIFEFSHFLTSHISFVTTSCRLYKIFTFVSLSLYLMTPLYSRSLLFHASVKRYFVIDFSFYTNATCIKYHSLPRYAYKIKCKYLHWNIWE